MQAIALLALSNLAESKKIGYNKSIKGPQRFRQAGESCTVIQVESESPLSNQRLKQNVTANNIVPFARKAATVAA
jgi:hypothetical protein